MRQRYAPYMGCGRKCRGLDGKWKCRSYKAAGLTPRAWEVKAGEGERDGKTVSEQAAARDSGGHEQHEGPSEGAHLKM